MKKQIRAVLNSLFIACCACFMFACQNPLQPPPHQAPARGEGTFRLVIGNETAGRTILPTTTQSNFARYTLVFSSAGKDNVSADRTNDNLSDFFTLSAATWNLTVTAYMDNGKTKPAAQGIIEGIVINTGENVIRSLELKPIIENGAKGTFSWNIGYPTGVTVASMKITPLDASGTPEQTLYFIGGTPTVSKNNTSSPLSLNTGYYKVVFSLSNGAHNTGREEYLHIYKNMDSRFEYTFTMAHFTVYSVTNGADSGPGSLRHAISNVVSGSTILIESGVGTIQLKASLTITKSLTIEGNGTTITLDPSFTTPPGGLISPFGYDSDVTVTIKRVHFKDIKGPGSAIAVIASSEFLTFVNLESCIFSGNQSDSLGGSIIVYSGYLNVKGCTFYGNSSGSGGAICGFTTSNITLTGNLFYRNGASTTGPVIDSSGTLTSYGYNVVDVPLGTGSSQSGWVAHSTDKTISFLNIPISNENFKLISTNGARNVITSRPAGYPTVDFYGDPIPATNAAAGAVQAVN